MANLCRLKGLCNIATRLKAVRRQRRRAAFVGQPGGGDYAAPGAYETQSEDYQGYQIAHAPAGMPRRDEYNTFVSSHYRNMGEDIVEYLNRKKIEYNESPIKYTLKFCPFCPPHRFKSDNLFKHEIFKNSGNSYCHRCGYRGSLFDFKAQMGDLPGAFDFAADPIGNPFGQRKAAKDPDVTLEDVNKFEDNLFNNPEYRGVLEYLTTTRGFRPEVLRKYHVGAGTFKFKTITGKLEPEKCVVFPWLATRPKREPEPFGAEPGQLEGELFDYAKDVERDKLLVNRIKVRSIHDKARMKILPRGGAWGMFGGHLINEALERDSVVLAEGEFDAMSVFQQTGRTAISLPNGANSLPLALLPKLEKFNEIFLWMDFDAAGQSSISHFANKLGIQRVKVVNPIKAASQPTGQKGKAPGQGPGAAPAQATKVLKDANEVLLNGTVDMETYFKNATVINHSQILSFNDIRQLVYNELSDPVSTCGIKSLTMPGLSNLLKGHRRGELTVWTGSTGSGKTTLLSQLSLDYCLQGVSTLWGSFEINNVRLAKTMLRQFSGRNLENNLNEFDYYANKFNELPLRFLKFHGSTNVDIVLDAMDYAVYVYDVQHIIIDNLQFMLSNYSNPSPSATASPYASSVKDVYELQNRTIEKFRRFVTNKNVHLSLVVHPRKEADGIQLGLSSVFGSVKSTQEADNVIILQNILNESRCLDVKKNRFAGLLGRVYFKFDPVSLTAQEYKVTEYLNEYVTNTPIKTLKGGKEQAAAAKTEIRERVPMSSFKIPAQTAQTPGAGGGRLAPAAAPAPAVKAPQTAQAVAPPSAFPAPNPSTIALKAASSAGTTNFSFFRDRDRNNIGLVGIDLLNLNPVTQQVNKMVQRTLSTEARSGTSEGAASAAEVKAAPPTPRDSGGSEEGNNNGQQPSAPPVASEEPEEEYLSMRGIKINRDSSIKELREFIKKNGLGELVKTAGKGVKKEGIYDSIKTVIPHSAIVGGKQAPDGAAETQARAPASAAAPAHEGAHPFGVSTAKSLLTAEFTEVLPSTSIAQFKLKYLSKLPKSLYQPAPQPAPEEAPAAPERAVHANVYYSANYDPLLVDGIVYVDTRAKLDAVGPLFERARVVGVDIETTGLDHRSNQVRLIQLAAPNQPTVIVDLFKLAAERGGDNASAEGAKQIVASCAWLRAMLRSTNTTKVFHNGKFDINFLRTYGLELGGPIFDTMIASKLLVASRFISCKLTHVSERYLNIVLDKTQQYSDWSTLQLFEEQLLYSARDAFVLLPLYVILEHLLKINHLADIADVEFKCVLATSDMELNGVRVDRQKLEQLQDELKREHLALSDNLHQQLNESECGARAGDINLNSQKQILEKLQALKIVDRAKKQLISDTSEPTLIRNAANPIIASLRDYRKAHKALTAFTQKLPNHISAETSRIYPNYNQLGAESGRFSCDGPNLQQVPREKKFRECFVASEGNKFVIADFSQIELRIAAEIANDERMIQAYQEVGAAHAQNVDLHSLTASILKSEPRSRADKDIAAVNKEERQLAKAVNFGLIFGMSMHGLRAYAETGYNVKLSQKEAKEIHSSFFNNFKGILNWHNSVKVRAAHAQNNRPTMVRTLGNRLSVFDSFSFTRSLNYPVQVRRRRPQGTSADITKETMARLVDLVGPLGAKIVLCVHDEIILEVPERNAQQVGAAHAQALDVLVRTMVEAGNKYLKKVPVEAMGSIGDSWADKS